jgi:hypothetical protein
MGKKKQFNDLRVQQFEISIPGIPVVWKEVRFPSGGFVPLESSIEYVNRVRREIEAVIFQGGTFKIDKKYAVSLSIRYLLVGEKEFNNKPPSLHTLNKSILNAVKKAIPLHLVYEFISEKKNVTRDIYPCVKVVIVLHPCF